MKIILSRKGFDSGYGGCASPIFPDGSMISLPIPEATSKHSMGDLHCGDIDIIEVARDLAPANPDAPLCARQAIHLDPWLRRTANASHASWLPAFGQDDIAQSHLANKQVGPGDLFLFFGWFRRVERFGPIGRWRFVPMAPNLHILFGWLQIGQVLKVSEYDAWRTDYPWLDNHPHVQNRADYTRNNSLYVAREHLSLGPEGAIRPGGGTFSHFHPSLQLTHPASPLRSTWRVPGWMAPHGGPESPTLSYHGSTRRWGVDAPDADSAKLESVAKGQEFVLTGFDERRASSWLDTLFASSHQ